MSEEFASNSHKSREERKKVPKVIQGEATLKKKTSTQKFAENFISDDVQSVKNYIMFDVLVPALKDTFYDMVTSGLSMLLGTDVRSSRRHGGGPNQRESYSGYYNNRNTSRTSYGSRSDDRDHIRVHDRESIDDILLDTRGEAEAVRDIMDGIIDNYGSASVLDLKEATGMSTTAQDSKYGWYDLNSSSIARTKDGYLLRLPRVTLLD